jgi:hypothetical protein
MIETTNVINPSEYWDGWVLKYVKAVEKAGFPPSYSLLAGLTVLTSLVGRRGKMECAGYKLYPPMWVLLLGPSGIGKSQSINMARFVAKEAQKCVGHENFLIADPDTMTRRGFMEIAKKRQSGRGEKKPLEGLMTVDEASSVLTKRTGNETIVQFFLKASEGHDIEDFTGQHGHAKISDFSMGMVLASSLALMREATNLQELAGGFLFRFMIVHELERPEVHTEAFPWTQLIALAEDAVVLREAVPYKVTKRRTFKQANDVAPAIRDIEVWLRKQVFDNGDLRGFWHRLVGYSQKFAMAMCISDGTFVITGDHINRAHQFLVKHMFPPVEAYMEELAYGRGKLQLFGLADDLYLAGAAGISIDRFMRRLPGTTTERTQAHLRWMRKMGLIYEGIVGHEKRVFRLKKWIP